MYYKNKTHLKYAVLKKPKTINIYNNIILTN